MECLRWVVRLTQRTATNFIFYRRTAVRNILQDYFGSGEDNDQSGSIPGNTQQIARIDSRRYSVIRAAGTLWVPTMHSRDILQQAKGYHLYLVHSDQMVLEIIRRGRLVW
jgi:hypothetical protein